MYKKILLAIVVVLFCLISVGCCKYNVIIDVNEKGGVDLQVRVLGTSLIQDEVIDQRIDFKQKGFKIENEQSGKLRGFTATKSYDEFNELEDNSLFAVKNFKPQIAHFKNYIVDRYIVNLDVNLTDNLSQTDINELRNSEFKNYIDINFQFNLPINTNIDVTNGSLDFTSEKKILKWNIDIGQKNEIIFMATDWHEDTIIAFIIAGLVLAITSYRYKKKITGENQASDISNSNIYKIALVGAGSICCFLLWQYISIPSDINTAYAKRNIVEVETKTPGTVKEDTKKTDNQKQTDVEKTSGEFPDSFKDRGVILENGTFVYKEPIKSSNVLVKLNKDDVVAVKEEFKGFYFIMTKDKTLGCVETNRCKRIKQ